MNNDPIAKIGQYTEQKRSSLPPESVEFSTPGPSKYASFKVAPSPDISAVTTSEKIVGELNFVKAASEVPRLVIREESNTSRHDPKSIRSDNLALPALAAPSFNASIRSRSSSMRLVREREGKDSY